MQTASKKSGAGVKRPTPAQIKAARIAANLTQEQAGARVHAALRTWQQWEGDDRAMPLAAWELFQLKIKYGLE